MKRTQKPTESQRRTVGSFAQIVRLAVGMTILCYGAVPGYAQRRNFSSDLTKQYELLEVPRPQQSLLQDAQSAIKRKQWSEATLALGAILGLESLDSTPNDPNAKGKLDARRVASREQAQDYFIDEAIDGANFRSLKVEAMALLTRLPEEGAQIVELRYGVTAKSMLEAAIAASDWDGIATIAATRGFTVAGRKASWLMAERWLSQGEPAAAAQILEALIEQPMARREYGTGLLAMAATSWKFAGQSVNAMALFKRAHELWGNVSVELAGRTVALNSNEVQIQSALEQIPMQSMARSIRRSRDWLLPQGRPDNNGHGFAGKVVPVLKWHTPLHPAPQEREAVMQFIKSRSNEKASDLPSRIPLAIGPWVVARTYDQRLLGIDRRTGLTIWNSSFEQSPIRLPQVDIFDQRRELAQSDRLKMSVWSDVALGQLSSDGDRLYGVCATSAVQAAENLVAGGNATITRGQTRSQSNVLRAWSIEKQGSIAWEIGGDGGLTEPAMAGALFLGPPTPHQGQLLVLVELNGEVFLAGLAPESGRSKWMQQLVANTSIQIAADPVRRGLSASPSVEGNMVYCPTLSGHLIAYDLGTRMLRWAIRYPQGSHPSFQINPVQGTYRENNDPMRPHSIEFSANVSEGCVIHMPCEYEATSVYAVDAKSGAKLWSQFRDNFRYVGGVWENKVLLIGDRKAVGIDLRTGKKAWSDIDLSDAKIAGRGARNGNSYFVPLANQEIVEIDISRGEILSRFRVEQSLGNLVATENALISFGPLDVTYYVLRSKLQKEIDLEELAHNDTPRSLSNRAELSFADGDIEAALNSVRRAYELEPSNVDTQMLLRKISVAAVQSDFSKYLPIVGQYDALMSQGPERTRYLTLMIEAFERQGELHQAFRKSLELLLDRLSYHLRSTTELDQIESAKGFVVSIDRWLAVRLHRNWENADGLQREKIVKELDDWLGRIPKELLLNLQAQQFVAGLPPIDKLTFDIAVGRRRIPDDSSAEWLLNRLSHPRDQAFQKKVAKEQLGIYAAIGRWSSAVRLAAREHLDWKRLLDVKPVQPTADDELNALQAMAGQGMMSEKDLDAMDLVPEQWPKGMVHVTGPEVDLLGSTATDGNHCDLLHHEGDSLLGWQIERHSNELAFRNPWGAEGFRVSRAYAAPYRETSFLAHVVNNLVMVEMMNEIVAIDTLRPNGPNTIRWTQPLSSSSGIADDSIRAADERTMWGESRRRMNREGAVLAASSHGLIVRIGDELQCLDLISGRKVWGRKGFSRLVQAGISGIRLYAADRQTSAISILDCRDGALLATSQLYSGMEIKSVIGRYALLEQLTALKLPQLQLFDMETSEVKLDRTFAADTRGCLVERSQWVAVQPSETGQGSLFFWDLKSGQEYRYDFPSEKRLKELRVARFGKRLLLLPECTNYELTDIDLELARGTVSGPVLAIDARDGHPLWDHPVMCYKMTFPVDQCRTSPIATFVRRIKWRVEEQGEILKSTSSIALIDLRTGETVYATDMISTIQGKEFAQYVSPGSRRVFTSFSGHGIQLRFSEEDCPPNPVKDFGNASASELRRQWSDLMKRQNQDDEARIKNRVDELFNQERRMIEPRNR